MFGSARVLAICGALLSLSVFAHGRRVAELKRDCSSTCLLQFRCDPYTDEPVWAIVDGQCEVFKNGCIFATENCNRRNSCLDEMTAISQEKCQPYCHYCQSGAKDAPVCGVYFERDGVTTNTEYKTFNSLCDLKRKSCEKGKAYMFQSEGACPSEQLTKGK